MYKVPIYVLQDIVNKLENSNRLLREINENNPSLEITTAIIENEKEIERIKLNFNIDG